jgi:hypothetical protein
MGCKSLDSSLWLSVIFLCSMYCSSGNITFSNLFGDSNKDCIRRYWVIAGTDLDVWYLTILLGTDPTEAIKNGNASEHFSVTTIKYINEMNFIFTFKLQFNIWILIYWIKCTFNNLNENDFNTSDMEKVCRSQWRVCLDENCKTHL